MVELEDLITNIGYLLLPISFVAFLLVRPLMFIWRKNYSKILKAIWYFALGTQMLSGDHRVDTIVMLLAFIEGYDLVFQHFEDNREK